MQVRLSTGTAMNTGFRLRDFDISEETGFVPPSPPLACLPEYFAPWEVLARNLPALIREKSIRQAVHELPPLQFSKETLTSEREWQRAYVLLTFLAQAYMWVYGERGLPDRVPQILAVPLCTVADRLGVPPMLCYPASVLHNWGVRDLKGALDSSNLHALTTFTGSSDESWFYTTHVRVEIAAVPGLKGVAQACSLMATGQNTLLCECLSDVQKSLEGMRKALKTMYEHCNPTTYFVQVRQFQAGLNGLNILSQGILYEGVDSKPRKYHGTSAAQSAAVQTFDIFLGAEHTGNDAKFLEVMRGYMLPRHRDFLKVLTMLPMSVRQYVTHSKDHELVMSYNAAVEALADFRSEHIILATRYILMQKSYSVNASLDAKGTGGTDFIHFLKNVRDDTLALKVSQ